MSEISTPAVIAASSTSANVSGLTCAGLESRLWLCSGPGLGCGRGSHVGKWDDSKRWALALVMWCDV